MCPRRRPPCYNLTMYEDFYINKPSDLVKLLDEPIGYSVPRVAKILGISEQSVHRAVQRGALIGKRHYVKGRKQPLSIEIDRESVIAYARSREGRQKAEYGYRFDQNEMPI